MLKNNKKGFTIIELLIVIAIIGLLATISMVALNGARLKGRDAKRVGDIRQVQTALELYFNDQNSYPLAATAITLGDAAYKVLCDGGFVATANATNCPLNKIYMGIVPTNPAPGGTAYLYSTTTNLNYNIGFTLEDATGGYALGAHTASERGIQ